MAVDRNHINDTFFGGEAIPSAVSHMPEWRDSFQDRWAPMPGPGGRIGAEGGWPYPHRLGLARELLIEADYPNGFVLDLYAPWNLDGMPELPDVGETIAAMWEEIGIDVNLTVSDHQPIQAMLDERAMSGKIFLVRSPVLPLSLSIGGLWVKFGSSYQEGPFYEYPFITEWKERYDTMADPVERERLAIELGDFWYDNYLSVPLLWVFSKVGYNPDVLKGYNVNQLHFGPTRYHEYTVPIYR